MHVMEDVIVAGGGVSGLDIGMLVARDGREVCSWAV
jgi:ribulose 1,5-bisphosphate synthetase/thiazole synthase